MARKMLLIINAAGAGLALLLLSIALWTLLSSPAEVDGAGYVEKSHPLPKPPFQIEEEAYASIDSLFHLKFAPPGIQLPDLRKLLAFPGPNSRPDADQENTSVRLNLASSNEEAEVQPGEKLYLSYDRSQRPPRFIFSPGNRPTNLWLEAGLEEGRALVSLSLLDEEGKLVRSPSELASFTLEQKEENRFRLARNWEMGPWRVDGTLLARQKVKWYGEDLFFKRHGGEEFEELADKQRLDIGEGEEQYSLFVGQDDILVWDGKRWAPARPGKESLGKPLLQVKKISERLMGFDLWDEGGKNRISLNLLKIQERWSPEKLKEAIRCLSARTRTQYIFEIEGERVVLNPYDWLVRTEEGWTKLSTEEEIDAYVERGMTGPLFVFDGMVEEEGKQSLMGTLFNASRTKMDSFSLDECKNTPTVIGISKEQLEKSRRPVAARSSRMLP